MNTFTAIRLPVSTALIPAFKRSYAPDKIYLVVAKCHGRILPSAFFK